MSIPALPPKPSESHNPWATSGEVPLGPPMPLSNAFVKGLMQMFPTANPEILSRLAYKFLDNMRQALGTAIDRIKRKSHAAAEAFKRAIQGEE